MSTLRATQVTWDSKGGGGEGIGDREAVSLADLPDFCCREGAD